MTNKEYWSEVSVVIEELKKIVGEAENATREKQEELRLRQQKAGARLAALNRTAESGGLKHV